nr:hypothetical protein [Rhizobium leguminosarum]
MRTLEADTTNLLARWAGEIEASHSVFQRFQDDCGQVIEIVGNFDLAAQSAGLVHGHVN